MHESHSGSGQVSKRMVAFVVLAVVAAAALGYYFGYDHGFEKSAGTSEEARYMDIESYVRTSISELSPIKEQVGGTFFVTDIDVERPERLSNGNSSGRGTVEYEDGHNAYTADFTYTVDESGKPTVTDFKIREEAAVVPKPPEQIFCTMEAKQCPDGSYVGRTGPKCEFAACPAPTGSGTIRGTVLIGPVCPVVQYPPDGSCDDRPYQDRFAVVNAGNKVVKEFNSDAAGKFSVTVPVGSYTIRLADTTKSLPHCSSETFSVRANETKEVAVSCDSGIR